MRRVWQAFIRRDTSSVEPGYTTQNGRSDAAAWWLDQSDVEWCSRSWSPVLTFSLPTISTKSTPGRLELGPAVLVLGRPRGRQRERRARVRLLRHPGAHVEAQRAGEDDHYRAPVSRPCEAPRRGVLHHALNVVAAFRAAGDVFLIFSMRSRSALSRSMRLVMLSSIWPWKLRPSPGGCDDSNLTPAHLVVTLPGRHGAVAR